MRIFAGFVVPCETFFVCFVHVNFTGHILGKGGTGAEKQTTDP